LTYPKTQSATLNDLIQRLLAVHFIDCLMRVEQLLQPVAPPTVLRAYNCHPQVSDLLEMGSTLV